MKKAIYPGSFDPVTYGHLDIIKRAAKMYDEVVIGVLNNMQKNPLFSVEERVKILEEVCKEYDNVKVDQFGGLLVDYTKENGIDVTIRGLRAVTDFEYELQIAQYNYMLSDGALETVFLATSPEYSYISSSGVREVANFNGDISKLVPDVVAKYVYEKVNSKR